MNNLLGCHQALSVTISRSSTWSTVLIDDVEVVSVDLHTREEHGSRSWNHGVNLFHRKVGQAGDKVEGVEDLELVSSVDKRVIGLRTAEALRNLKQGLKWKIGKFAKQQFLTNLFSSITNWSKPWEITQRNCRGDTLFSNLTQSLPLLLKMPILRSFKSLNHMILEKVAYKTIFFALLPKFYASLFNCFTITCIICWLHVFNYVGICW